MRETSVAPGSEGALRMSLPLAGTALDDPSTDGPFTPFTRLVLRAHGAAIDPKSSGAVAFLTLESGSGLQLHAAAGRTDGEALPLTLMRAQMKSRRRMLVEIPDISAERCQQSAPPGERNNGFISLLGAIIRDKNGDAIGMLGLLDREQRRHSRDTLLTIADLARGVAALHAARQEAQHATTSAEPGLIDPVTGLPGRRSLVAQIEHMASPDAGRALFSLFRIDFGGLAALNDAYGRDIADRYLRHLADRLEAVAPVPGHLAHLGGSGFVILVPGRMGSSDADSMAQRMMDRLREPAQIGTLELPVRLSVGLAMYPADLPAPRGEASPAEEAAQLLLAAEAAVAHAKTQGDGRHSRAIRAVTDSHTLSNGLELDLQAAASAGAFHLNWMATIDTASEHVTGFEALLRWNRPGFGEVSPGLFIPVAEASGTIEMLDSWSLRAACIEAQGWNTPLSVAVNISSMWLSHGRLSRTVRRVLDETGLDPSRLQLELSARTTLDEDGHLRRELSQVRAMGVRLTLDDFGSGYSSLGALTLFPFNKVKLDRQFIAALGQDRRVEIITRSVLQMVQSLGMTCCAEGVETEAQLAFLDAHGCDEIQGYLLGRPAPKLPPQAMEAEADRTPA
ncbi:EAL domain-containing protein [Acetobacteraceae bacterium KSS8]|uniref:EAL domain-containing protein n=1 Tax=Endosaccharibacter trunci TaxID=2812733 RepID=A0ABT1WAH8_9PROT|nr:EAL domain-containing protein [Acetobacteraceae bacterium KSS8]